MHQCYFVVVLGVISLHGRTNPYIPIVHQEKNHIGQIEFAKRINDLIHLNPQVQFSKFRLKKSTWKLSKMHTPSDALPKFTEFPSIACTI